ncbi:MAG: hypothetical protein HFF84_09175 [Oscillibacter sp.]|nr:hypothetical protein [Oscillibacter sp.]
MKKIIAMMLLVAALFSLASFAGASAYVPYTLVPADVLTDQQGLAREGTTIPGARWNLAASDYTGKFNYSATVYGNYLLSTSTGKIFVTTDSSASRTVSVTTQTLTLMKVLTNGAGRVSTRDVPREGVSTVPFVGLEEDSYVYFLALSKIRDGVTLTGEFVASETR